MVKENSTEEDWNYLNKMVKEYKIFGDLYNEEYGDTDRIYQALEHILSDYNRVLKENEELKEKNKKMCNEYCPFVQKIKDKIEEIKKEYNKLDEQIEKNINDVNKDLSKYYENKEKIGEMQMLSYFIDNLQELIEESEES